MDPLPTEVIRVAGQVLGSNISILSTAKASLIAALSRITAKTELLFLAEDQPVINAFVNAVV